MADSTESSSDAQLAERLESVRGGIAEALRESERSPAEVTLIVVTKFHPASVVRELWRLGVREVGESRNQEALAKSLELTDLPLGWNFIGQLQSKKAKQVRSYAHSVHSLDRESVVIALAADLVDAAPTVIDGFIQLNLTDDPNRGGIAETQLESLTELILRTPGLLLRGVMAVAPLDVEPRRAFERVRVASERMIAIAPLATAISTGMSGDYRQAILEGATHLRIGSAITGNRPAAG